MTKTFEKHLKGEKICKCGKKDVKGMETPRGTLYFCEEHTKEHNWLKVKHSCIVCGKVGKKIKHDVAHFCSKEHIALYDEKMNEAEKKLNLKKKCCICGKTLDKNSFSVFDSERMKKGKGFEVTTRRFCSETCLEDWGMFIPR